MKTVHLIKRLSGIYSGIYQVGATGTKRVGACFSARIRIHTGDELDEILFIEFNPHSGEYVRYYRLCETKEARFARDYVKLSGEPIGREGILALFADINKLRLEYNSQLLIMDDTFI